jgi:hypothetical protein
MPKNGNILGRYVKLIAHLNGNEPGFFGVIPSMGDVGLVCDTGTEPVGSINASRAKIQVVFGVGMLRVDRDQIRVLSKSSPEDAAEISALLLLHPEVQDNYKKYRTNWWNRRLGHKHRKTVR